MEPDYTKKIIDMFADVKVQVRSLETYVIRLDTLASVRELRERGVERDQGLEVAMTVSEEIHKITTVCRELAEAQGKLVASIWEDMYGGEA